MPTEQEQLEVELHHLHLHNVNALYYIQHHNEPPAYHLQNCNMMQKTATWPAGAVYQCNKTDIRNPHDLQKRVDVVLQALKRC